MIKGKRQTKLKFERMPCASAAAMLASSLCAFLFTGIPGTNIQGTPMLFAMLLCAVFTMVTELASLPNSVLFISCAAFGCAGSALFFVPFGGESIYTAMTAGADVSTTRVLTMVMLLCGALCLAVCALNRSFVMRCIAAVGLLIMLILFIWLRFQVLTVPAMLITAYILIVLCQVCAFGKSPTSDTPREMWFVLFSLIAAVIVFSLPYPSTRIQWEKLFEIRPTGQFEQLGETLGIEQLNDAAETSESGSSEDQSSIGGWLDLISDVQLQVKFSDNAHSDRLTGGIYDCYTGTGWVCTTEVCGTGYASPSDVLSVSESDLYGSAHISKIEKAPVSDSTQSSLFYPPYSHNVLSINAGEIAVRKGMRLIFEQSNSPSYEVRYYKQPCKYELTVSERESLLALPETLPERVRTLARETVQGCSNDEDKACKLMHLLSSCGYETRVKNLPEGRDFVDYFLFDSMEGYCAYFASAMAVLARCVDIPARYVQGYYIGSGDTLNITISSDDAHAWAELYIDGSWIIYDPAVSPMNEILDDTENSYDKREPKQDNSSLNRILVYSYAVIAAAAVVFIAFRPSFRRIPWRIKLKRKYGKSSGYPVIARCGALIWVLAACGVKRGESETLNEFGERIRRECEWLDEAASNEISEFFEQTSRVLYCQKPAADGKKANIAQKVRKRYIKAFGAVKYLRGYRRASLRH